MMNPMRQIDTSSFHLAEKGLSRRTLADPEESHTGGVRDMKYDEAMIKPLSPRFEKMPLPFDDTFRQEQVEQVIAEEEETPETVQRSRPYASVPRQVMNGWSTGGERVTPGE